MSRSLVVGDLSYSERRTYRPSSTETPSPEQIKAHSQARLIRYISQGNIPNATRFMRSMPSSHLDETAPRIFNAITHSLRTLEHYPFEEVTQLIFKHTRRKPNAIQESSQDTTNDRLGVFSLETIKQAAAQALLELHPSEDEEPVAALEALYQSLGYDELPENLELSQDHERLTFTHSGEMTHLVLSEKERTVYHLFQTCMLEALKVPSLLKLTTRYVRALSQLPPPTLTERAKTFASKHLGIHWT